MVSVNASANAYVLANLRQINSDLATTQTRIGTGKKVNSAADNSVAWIAAQKIQSDLKAQDGLSTGIATAKAKADAAIAAINSANTIAAQINTIAVGAASSGDYTNAQTKIDALQTQILSVLGGAGIDGENWATDASAAKSVTIGVNNGTPSTVSITTTKLNLAATGATVVFSGTTAITTAGTATAYGAAATTFTTSLTTYLAQLQAFSDSLGIQQDFQKALASVRSAALSNLVDADLTEENAKISALQTQQQLAYQALSLSNSSASNILRLFQ